MFELIRSTISSTQKNINIENFTESDIINVLNLVSHHSLSHVVAEAVIKNNVQISETLKNQFERVVFRAAQRYCIMQNALYEEKEILNAQHIPFIVLKGCVMCRYYPQPWIRSCCDIDILVKNEDHQRAKKALIENGIL